MIEQPSPPAYQDAAVERGARAYTVRRVELPPPDPVHAWGSAIWSAAGVARVEHFHPSSTSHRPVTQFRLLHDQRHIYIGFEVADRFVRVRHTRLQDMVCQDSCVEAFLQPAGGAYLNFEVNAGGTMLLYCVEDASPAEGALFKRYSIVPEELCRMVAISSSLPRVVEPEIEQPVTWRLSLRIPVELFEHYAGPIGELSGRAWRGNFFKCGDQTSHPHWASWRPIGENLRFHAPEYFGDVLFE